MAIASFPEVSVCKLSGAQALAAVSAVDGAADAAVSDDDPQAVNSNADAAISAVPNRRVVTFFTLSP